MGCRNSSEEPSATPVVPPVSLVEGMSAEPFLQSIFARYRAAESYRDTGRVRLSFERQGRRQTEDAPMQIWFDRDELYLQAYDVRLTTNRNQFTAWIQDPTTADFDAQVVRLGPLIGRPTVNDLLADAVLSDRLAAGLAGPPPQLEWLFAAEPMRRLFEDEYEIKFAESREINGQRCIAVEVQANDGLYQFYIDQTAGVIRRVDLPPFLLPAAFQSDDVAEMRLTLELSGATFQSPDQPAALAPLPDNPRFLKRFIPLPPTAPPDQLGQYPASFAARDQTGQVQLSQHGSDRDASVLAFADGATSPLVASMLAQWASLMRDELQRQVRVVLITDEAGFRQLPRDLGLPVMIDRNHEIATAMATRSGDLAVLGRDGRIAWLQSSVSPDGLMQLGPIIGDVLDGVNVPQRMRQQWQSDRRAYERALSEAASR